MPPFFASISAYTRVLFGATATPIFPHTPSGSPLPVSWFQVVPPSVDLYSPLPGPPLSDRHGSRMNWYSPAYSTCVLFGSKVTSTPPVLSSLYSTFVQFCPPSVVR